MFMVVCGEATDICQSSYLKARKFSFSPSGSGVNTDWGRSSLYNRGQCNSDIPSCYFHLVSSTLPEGTRNV